MREYAYIICPNGCDIKAQIEERGDGSRRICFAGGVAYPKRRAYVEQELTDPRRNIATPVLVKSGTLLLTSVRLTDPTSRDRTLNTVDGIKKYTLTAPVKVGVVVILRLMRYDMNMIVAKSVPESKRQRSWGG